MHSQFEALFKGSVVPMAIEKNVQNKGKYPQLTLKLYGALWIL